jgi:hypothetical protein
MLCVLAGQQAHDRPSKKPSAHLSRPAKKSSETVLPGQKKNSEVSRPAKKIEGRDFYEAQKKWSAGAGTVASEGHLFLNNIQCGLDGLIYVVHSSKRFPLPPKLLLSKTNSIEYS